MRDKKQIVGMAAALLANVIFGFSFLFSKLALSVAHPLVILSARFTVAFVIMNIMAVLGIVKINLKGKKLGGIIAMGIAQPLCYFIFELYGLSLVSSALSGIIIALVPIGVILISTLILREKPTKLQWLCTFVSLIGISLISILSNDGAKSYFLGIILLILAVISAAIFNILSNKQAQNFSAFERTYMMFLIGFIGFNLISVFVLKGEYLPSVITAFKSPSFIAAIVYLSGVSSVAAFILYNYSTSIISAVRASAFSNIITVVSIFAGIVILREKFSFVEVLLCVPIILGVWGVNFKKDAKLIETSK